MKTFEEIEAFIRKAMDKNLLVGNRLSDNEIIVKNDNYAFSITKDKERSIIIMSLFTKGCTFINRYSISITDRESALFDILIEDVKDYIQNYSYEILENFFEEDKPITIDNLEFD